MSKPVVSIITPTYNHERYIENCLKSVINQSFNNWEMIIIDDHSTDKNCEIVNNYLEDKRIKLIRHSKNWGIKRLSESYNQALKLSRGKYIAILEGDDFWPKHKLERQIKDFQDKNVVLSYGDWVMTDGEGRPIKLGMYDRFPKNSLYNIPLGSILDLFSELNFNLMSPTVVMKKEVLVKNGGFQKNKYYPFVDIPTYLSFSLKGKFHYHKEILGFYRKQGNSVWFSFAKDTKALLRKEIDECIRSFINKNREESGSLKRDVREKSKDVLSFKSKNKNLILLYHYLVFNNNKQVYGLTKEILLGRNSILLKLVTVIIILILPIKKYLILSLFFSQLLFYRLKRVPLSEK